MSTSPPLDLDRAIVDLVGKDQVKVPPYPAVAFRIEAVVRSGDYGVEDLAKLVASDQVLAADVLRCANSVVYSRGNPCASVKGAVARIGAKEMARLALASGLAAHALTSGKLAPLRRRAWMEALASALLAQALAPGRGLAPDIAFSAGLLHDFGKVIAIACVEDLLSRRDDVAPRSEEEWNALVDRYHVELGVVMAARWDLPPVLADVISQHHAAKITATADPRYVETVIAVDDVVRALGERTHLGVEELEELDLVDPDERELVARTIAALPEFVASFESAEPPGAAVPSLVAAPEPPPRQSAPTPPPYPVVLRLGGKEYSYKLLGIGATHCMVQGPKPVPENLLLELKVACEPPVKGFGSVRLAWPEGGSFTLLLQPYGLNGDALSRWRALVNHATPAAA
ncbi:MAG TPA: HDOD domain-containing protein [Anaeromyxobacter sp.]|nr:HDOD domain-containing protein [Anaeromyxobacter sp.]